MHSLHHALRLLWQLSRLMHVKICYNCLSRKMFMVFHCSYLHMGQNIHMRQLFYFSRCRKSAGLYTSTTSLVSFSFDCCFGWLWTVTYSTTKTTNKAPNNINDSKPYLMIKFDANWSWLIWMVSEKHWTCFEDNDSLSFCNKQLTRKAIMQMLRSLYKTPKVGQIGALWKQRNIWRWHDQTRDVCVWFSHVVWKLSWIQTSAKHLAVTVPTLLGYGIGIVLFVL